MEAITTMPKVNRYKVTWEKFSKDIYILANQILTNEIRMRERYKAIYGIPRGGLVVATCLSHILGIPLILDARKIKPFLLWEVLICDDVSDTGKTLQKYEDYSTVTLYRKDHTKCEPNYCVHTINKHIVFPWEVK